MGRPLRIEFEGGVYHVTARGNERGRIFRDRLDREEFLKDIIEEKERNEVLLYGWTLLWNHYHIVFETPLGNLVRFMHSLNTKYTLNFNRRHRRVGHLFQGRYKGIVIDRDSYMLEVIRYTHLNCVRAGIVKRPEDYKWSSYREYLSNRSDGIVNKAFILEQFSKNREEAKRLFKEFHREGIEKEESPFEKVVSGVILGAEGFIEKIKGRISNKELTKEIPERKRLKDKYKRKKILEIVKGYYGIGEREIRGKGGKLREAQKAGIYLLRKYTGMKIGEISQYFGGRDYTYVPKVVSRVEQEKRKNAKFRKRMEELEKNVSRFKT